MKRLILSAGMTLVLAACAPSMIHGNAAGGMIGMRGTINGQKKALAAADVECGKYNKVAVASGENNFRNSLSYQCVKP
jgi:hypothetical protein